MPDELTQIALLINETQPNFEDFSFTRNPSTFLVFSGACYLHTVPKDSLIYQVLNIING